VRTDGTGWCWGDNTDGEVSGGLAGDALLPLPISGTWLSLTPGASHWCGMRTDRTAWCWGSNSYGKLGIGLDPGFSRVPPTQVGG
jgi:alpha-tubulin suppressor-like RCC1 family protein